RRSICQPISFRRAAATSASPPLCPLPTNTIARPARGKNFCTAAATPAPARSIKASTSTPPANAVSSAARIIAALTIGESNQSSELFLRLFFFGLLLSLFLLFLLRWERAGFY